MENKVNYKLKISLNTEELISDATVYIDKYKKLKEDDFSSIRKLQLEFMNKFYEKYVSDFSEAFTIFHRTITGYYPLSIAEEFISLLKSSEYSVAIDKIRSVIKGTE